MTDTTVQTGPADPRAVVMSAFEAFRASLASGDWDAFLNHFHDDVEFWEPVPGEFNGHNEGKDRLRTFYEGQGERLKLDVEDPLSVVVDGERVVIEYEEEGTLEGAPFSNRVAMSYVVRDGRIALYREYLGDLAHMGGDGS